MLSLGENILHAHLFETIYVSLKPVQDINTFRKLICILITLEDHLI